MGINKSQAAALASGFLEELGTNERAGLQPKETLSILFQLAGELVDDCQSNLHASNSNATGTLSESIVLSDPRQTATAVSVDVIMEKYGLYVNGGVKGTKSGSGQFSFRTDMPSPDMIKSLLKGIKKARSKTTNVNRNKTPFANEKKNSKISDIQKAWGAARNIKMYGIRATGFLDKAIKTTEAKVDQRFGQAFEVDILNSLPNKL